MILTDTHTHLYVKEFDEDITTVINNALENNVSRLFLPNIDSSTINKLVALAEKHPAHLFPMLGIHPCSIKEDYLNEIYQLEKWLLKKSFFAIGEIGIDLFWDKAFLPQQQDAFCIQIELAKKFNLPIVIHCREAFYEVFEILDTYNDKKMRGIFHCFNGTLEQANHIISYGNFKLGIGGVVTFKNSNLDQVLLHLKVEDIVLETDAPYLSPVPYRGKRNESAYLIYIAEEVAKIKGISIEEVAKITTKNSIDIFGK